MTVMNRLRHTWRYSTGRGYVIVLRQEHAHFHCARAAAARVFSAARAGSSKPT
jgi:hypothetical protein